MKGVESSRGKIVVSLGILLYLGDAARKAELLAAGPRGSKSCIQAPVPLFNYSHLTQRGSELPTIGERTLIRGSSLRGMQRCNVGIGPFNHGPKASKAETST